PILNIEKYLLENNISQQAELESIDSRVKKEIEDAEAFAEESPYPEPEDGMKGLYATPIEEE
ncbi:MAG: thiamine pyrophosphate-dependent dehydrogenase E1 component subunit alpha, partial [Planctomycetes bacterium]|nr:thiamine pyrophosphate-dependent dehydrogenase E1 component subunit alpha [Planctomycetota bacterium]